MRIKREHFASIKSITGPLRGPHTTQRANEKDDIGLLLFFYIFTSWLTRKIVGLKCTL